MAGFHVKLFREAGYDANGENGEIQLSPMPGPATIKFYEVGVVTAGWIFLVEGSHDGVNWVTVNAAVTAANAGLEIASPWPYLKVTCSTWVGGAGDIFVSLCWVYD